MRSTLSVLLLLALTGLAGCKDKPVEAHTAKAPKKEVDVELSESALKAARLQTAKPTLSPRRSSVTAAGTIDFAPNRVARIGPPIGGRVKTVSATVGQKLAKGTLVVTIESAEVGKAQADLAAARGRTTQSEAEVAREERLLSGGASSERALLVARTEKDRAAAELRAAEDRMRTLGGAAAGGSSFALATPIEGSVLEVRARIGQPVGPTDTLVVVGEIDEVWLGIDVYERDVDKMHVGDAVRVTTVALPDRVFEGKVSQLGTALDPERRVLDARIVLPNPDRKLRPGMTATARVLGVADGDGGMAITVPRAALQSVEGLPYVFVEKEPGKYWMRPVERGADFEDGVEIVRGLVGDETIVVDGSFLLKSEVLREVMGAND